MDSVLFAQVSCCAGGIRQQPAFVQLVGRVLLIRFVFATCARCQSGMLTLGTGLCQKTCTAKWRMCGATSCHLARVLLFGLCASAFVCSLAGTRLILDHCLGHAEHVRCKGPFRSPHFEMSLRIWTHVQPIRNAQNVPSRPYFANNAKVAARCPLLR